MALDAGRAALAGHLARLGRRRTGAVVRRAVGVVRPRGGAAPSVGPGSACRAVRPARPARESVRRACRVRGPVRPARRARVRARPPGRARGGVRRGGRVREIVRAARSTRGTGRRARVPQGRVSLFPVRHARVGHLVGGARPGGGRECPCTGQPYVPLAVRGRRHPCLRPLGDRHEPQGRLADPQQRARHEADRAGAHVGAVQSGAVGGAEVGDRDVAVGGDGHGAVHPGDVRVVERDVGVGRAAELDLAAVQQVDAAGVGTGDHVELGRDVGRLGVRVGFARGAEAEHGAVGQRGLAQGAALGVEPLRAGVEHHLTGARALTTGERRGQRGGDRGQCRAGRCGDQHVAARGAAPHRSMRAQRVYDGQPDLHRRQRSLRAGARAPGTEAVYHGPPPRTSPTATRARRPVLHASSHLPLTTRPSPAIK